MKPFSLISIFLLCFLSYAQESNKSADKNFNRLWYKEAARQYEAMLDRGKDSKELLQKVADAYYFNTDMQNASKWYAVLFSKYEDVLEPEYIFKYIHSLKGVGNYPLAKALMKAYGNRLENTPFKVAQLQENDTAMDALLNSQPQFYITPLSINSAFSDFGTSFYKDQVVFATASDTAITRTRTYRWNEQPFLNLILADTVNDGRDLKNLRTFSDNINTRYHEAGTVFNKAGTVMYFTRNNYTNDELGRDEEGINHLKLYRTVLKDSIWTDVTELPFNSETYSVGHPALNREENKLYFVSDMPGSVGRTDIFVVDIYEDGTFSNPKNLGPRINTSGREMFPFVTGSKLYFASDGHLGLGGLDVFESEMRQGSFTAPVNLGMPLNSKRDDFAFIIDESRQRGYFSSNRTGGAGDDDIYSFVRIVTTCEQGIEGTVLNPETGTPEASASVTLFSAEGEELARTETGMDGTYLFEIKADCDTVYKVTAAKKGFEEGENAFTSTRIPGEINFVPLEIKPLNKLIVEEEGVLKIKIGIIYFDFDKAFIRNDAAIELNKVVLLMNEYPEMVIKIESHTDSRGNDAYNESLSDRRAKSTRAYIISQGIEASRIESAIGYGEKKLINECDNNTSCTNAKHDLNRRSEFIILKIR